LNFCGIIIVPYGVVPVLEAGQDSDYGHKGRCCGSPIRGTTIAVSLRPAVPLALVP